MADANYTATDNKTCCLEIDIALEADELFDAVETNNVSIVKNFKESELQRLCQVRRPFLSPWSSPKMEHQTAYQRACLLGCTDIVRCMLNASVAVDQIFPASHSCSTMRGAFMFACQSRSMPTIQALLDAGAPTDQTGSCSAHYSRSFIPGTYGRHSRSHLDLFPIHFPIIDNNLELFKLLLTPTTNTLVVDSWFTPLHLVCDLNRSITMIDLLLSYEDAEDAIVARTTNGKFPDELATDQAIVEYLRPTRLLAYARIEQSRKKNHDNELKALEEGSGFQISIKNLVGTNLTIVVRKETTVEDLKMRVIEIYGIPRAYLRIVHRGKRLQDGHLLTDYDIGKDSILHLVLLLKDRCCC